MTKFKSTPALFAATLCMAGMSPVESRECNFHGDDVLVIGGNSHDRVIPYAQQCNFCYFVPGKFDGASSAFKTYCESKYGDMDYLGKRKHEELIENCVWINEAMNADLTIVDIGPDPERNRAGPFYRMEQKEIFERNEYSHRPSNTECGPFVSK